MLLIRGDMYRCVLDTVMVESVDKRGENYWKKYSLLHEMTEYDLCDLYNAWDESIFHYTT
jgi:hypothetical protein